MKTHENVSSNRMTLPLRYMIWFIFNLGWNIPQLESTFPSMQPLNRWHFKLSTVSSKRMTENHSNLEFEQNGPIITHNGPMVTQNWNKMNQFFVTVIASPPKRWVVKRRWFHPSLWFTLWQFNHRVNFRGVRTKLTRLDYLINHF